MIRNKSYLRKITHISFINNCCLKTNRSRDMSTYLYCRLQTAFIVQFIDLKKRGDKEWEILLQKFTQVKQNSHICNFFKKYTLFQMYSWISSNISNSPWGSSSASGILFISSWILAPVITDMFAGRCRLSLNKNIQLERCPH